MLRTNTIFLGKLYMHLAEVDSTNLYLYQYIAKNKPIEGFVVWADKQYAGRGQLGSKWLATEALNLTTSILLLPKWLAAKDQFLLSQSIALSIVDLLLAYNIPKEKIAIKWPNDIYVQNTKIAGILIENTLKGHFIEESIVGIGLNINQTDFKENGLHATSLSLVLGKNFSIVAVLSDLCLFVEQRYMLLKQREKNAQIQAAYIEYLYQYNILKTYKIAATNTLILAKIVGLTPEGKLILEHNGETLIFGLKELIFI